MKEIFLTKGQVAIVDDEDFEHLSQWKWYALETRNTFYAAHGITIAFKKYQPQLMHHLILDVPKGYVCDHIDHNGLNNQRNNLRVVTVRQNGQNQRTRKTSVYPGVFWNKPNNKWCARIRVDKKIKHLGYFVNEIEAFQAYCDVVLAMGEEVLGFSYPDIPENERECRRPRAYPYLSPIVGINLQCPDDVVHFNSISEAEKVGGFRASNISSCLHGKHRSHSGYYWQLATNLGVH